MSQEKRLEMLNEYIKMNIAPILVENIPSNIFGSNSVVLPAELDISMLNGHYEGMEFVPPAWYIQIVRNASSSNNILVIDEISRVSKDDQMKFYELLKYRKIGTFDLPKNCVIIITCRDKSIPLINEKLVSLFVHI